MIALPMTKPSLKKGPANGYPKDRNCLRTQQVERTKSRYPNLTLVSVASVTTYTGTRPSVVSYKEGGDVSRCR